MSAASKSHISASKKILLSLMMIIILLIIAVAAAAFWAYNQQSAVLIRSANQVLSAYGIEILDVHGLQTGLQQSRADSVEFRIEGHSAVQRIGSLTLDYELRTLIQGEFSQLKAQSAILQLQQEALPGDAFLELSEISISCPALAVCNGSVALSASVPSISSTSPAINASDIDAVTRLNFDYNAPRLRADVEPGLEITLAQASIGGVDGTLLDIELLSLVSNQTWRFDLNTEEQLLVFDGGQLQLKAPVLRTQPDSDESGLSGFEAAISQVNGSYDLSDPDGISPWSNRLSTQIGLEITNVYTTLQPFNVWSYRWPINLSWDTAQNLAIDIEAITQDNSIAQVQMNQSFADGTGNLKFNTAPLRFSPSGNSLTTLISPLPLDADVISGELYVAADINWQLPDADSTAGSDAATWQPGGTLRIEATELTGVIDEIIFSGVTTSAQFQLQSDFSLISSATTRLRIGEIDPGLPLSNIETRFRVNSATGLLELLSLDFDMFGGALDSDPFTVNLNQEDGISGFGDSFELRMDGVDISQILSLSAYNGVSATGLVNGTLPIRLKGFKPIIEGGRLDARAPGGSIRYSAGDSATGNQSLDLVYQALEHYRYESLGANVNYNEAGELILEMQLQGESPELNNGQRINLNLNISDNIPALLQSLQAAQGITDRLEEMLE